MLRIYHGGRVPSHRARERALVEAGVEVSLAVPSEWPETEVARLDDGTVPIFELPVTREGDRNRHAYRSRDDLRRLLAAVRPDVLDIHEEPFSVAARQWLAAASPDLPVVMYTAQNVDKRLPPPFAQHEHAAHRRVAALYPCSTQAASVARGKGFAGPIDVLPLGFDESEFFVGNQTLDDEELVLGLFGRLVPQKGVIDAVEVLARINGIRPTRLVVVGNGPDEARARARGAALGVSDRLELVPWKSASELAAIYRTTHIVLVPSRPTATWVEQFGRVIVEAQSSGAVVAGYASGSIPEVAGEAAVLADVGAVWQLADRIAELVENPREYARRREQGIALGRTRTWAGVAHRQADLYRRVAVAEVPRLRLPRSPTRRRESARAEFGPTAETIAGTRPFALPLLRRGGTVAAALEAIVDGTAELAARLR